MIATLDLEMHLYFVYLYHTVTFAEGHQMNIFIGTIDLEGVTIINEDGEVRK